MRVNLVRRRHGIQGFQLDGGASLTMAIPPLAEEAI
jgi:hypothetical protein